MNSKITRDVLESYLACKYKGFLRQSNHQGVKSDYEDLLKERRKRIRLKAIEKILSQYQEDQIIRNVQLTSSILKHKTLFVLDVTVEDDLFSFCIDGLKKVPGASKLGDFHYIPTMFHGGCQIGKEQRLLLELTSSLLLSYQGIKADTGIVWLGDEVKSVQVRLNQGTRKIEQLVRELRQLFCSDASPKLILNNHCQICEFRQRCHEQAMQEDNLSLLRGISEKEIKKLSRKGIFTVNQLAHTFKLRRKGKRQAHTPLLHSHALKAMAIRDKKIYINGTPELPTKPVTVYFDIECDPDTNFVYLIGMIVVENGMEKSYSYWADNKDQEVAIFEQFINEVTRHDDIVIFCYGSLERAFLKRMRKVLEEKKAVDKAMSAMVNVLSVIYPHIYFPTYSNGLKDIGGYLGFSWTEPEASGIQSIVWRNQWEVEQIAERKRKLTAYNIEDCMALKKVTEVIRTAIAKPTTESTTSATSGSSQQVEFVKETETFTNRGFNWGNIKFFHPDYEFINKCAYFDYQREKVYVRAGKLCRRKKAEKRKTSNQKLRISQKVMIKASICPTCNSKEIINDVKRESAYNGPKVKRAFDLIVTPSGIKRNVIEFRTSVHQCLECGEKFIPQKHQRLDKHFHSLKSWAMLQHVEYKISFVMIQRMLEEFFGLRVHVSEVHGFKALMAEYYRTTYTKLLEKIVSGNLLHIDETDMKLQNGKGYVWVLTNLEEVVFIYRATRECEFLHELLKNFRGVLVSDFYAGYDSIECPQQKCLVHLMRDINKELLGNSYDAELQLITRPFGTLLRSIITTIDEHGLKHSHLNQHEKEVAKFYQFLQEQSISSDVAETLRKRLIKYRDKLFTFLQHDGVPWNNNNAEHAVKQFAYYREIADGMVKEKGLGDFLVLLSISQTCHYKGVSFLKFLLSRDLDIESFSEGARRKQKPLVIECYPEWFSCPHDREQKRKLLKGKPKEVPEVSPFLGR